MSRIPFVLVAAAAAAAGALALATPASAQTIKPNPHHPGPAQIVCLTCPPELVVSVAYRAPIGIVNWYVEVTNLGRTAPPSTASVTYWYGGHLLRQVVDVPSLAPGQTRVVAWQPYFFPLWEACVDTLDQVAERNETNNCT